MWEEFTWESHVGGIPCGKNHVWEELRYGGIPLKRKCERNRMCKKSCMGEILCGKNPIGRIPVEGIPCGRNPVRRNPVGRKFMIGYHKYE